MIELNNWYNRITGNQPIMQQPSGMTFQNPMQKMQYIINAMTNPAAFVKQQFPDIPENIQNNPNEILRYLQQTRGISDEQIRQISGINGRR